MAIKKNNFYLPKVMYLCVSQSVLGGNTNIKKYVYA